MVMNFKLMDHGGWQLTASDWQLAAGNSHLHLIFFGAFGFTTPK